MLGIDGSEFLVILIVFIVVVGPKDLPKMLKTIAKIIAYVRSITKEFRYQFDEAIRQAELDDLHNSLSDIHAPHLGQKLKENRNPLHEAVEDISDLDGSIIYHKSEKNKKGAP